MDVQKINGYDIKDANARTSIGNLNNLNTTEKNNLVGAINEHETKVNNHESRLETLEEDILTDNRTIFMGDSYALGVNPNSDNITSWAERLKSQMGLDNNNGIIIAEVGSGFLRQGTSGHTFLELLQSQINNISNKNTIKNIILCGGYNDNTYSLSDIRDAIITYVNYCYSQFPNCTVYIGCIGYRYELSTDGQTTRRNLARNVYPAYANNVASNMLTRPYIYLNGVENILKSLPKSLMYVNNAHPNQNGQDLLAYGIYQAFTTGSCKVYSNNTLTITNTDSTEITSSINSNHSGDIFQILIENLSIKFAQETEFNINNGTWKTIGDYNVNNFIGGIQNNMNVCDCLVNIQDYTLNRHTLPGKLRFNTDGTLQVYIWPTNSGSSFNFTKVKQIDINYCKMILPELFS